MKKLLLILIATIFIFTSCASHKHQVGTGPSKWETQSARQIYLIWGLVPLGQVDAKKLARGATNYEIVTEIDLVDWLINLLGGAITLTSRSVKVTR